MRKQALITFDGRRNSPAPAEELTRKGAHGMSHGQFRSENPETCSMAKMEWGLKRTCQSCGAKFYDLNRAHAACPKCGAVFDPEAVTKTKRGKAAPARPAPVIQVEPAVADAEEPAIEEAEEAEEEAVIEDTSELGQDNDDVAEVIENVDEEDER
jgi:uncharacterized protein (TIGR02300 family)